MSSRDWFLTIWMVISIVAGLVGGYLAYAATGNTQHGGYAGVRYFLLAYILGWVILKVWHYMDRVGFDRHKDRPDE